MKNIHILQTDKPSRLWMSKLGNIGRCNDTKPINKVLGNNILIYITFDEYIHSGDYLIHDGVVYNCMTCCEDFIHLKGLESLNREQCKKIVLTTDPVLIKDGIQRIDDNFLM